MLGVSPDTVRRLVDRGELKAASAPSGRREVDAAGLARFMTASGRPSAKTRQRSARNAFPGIVTRVTKDAVAAQVELQAGPFRVVSLMTREAADELELAPGVRATAQVKATNVVIEVP